MLLDDPTVKPLGYKLGDVLTVEFEEGPMVAFWLVPKVD